MVCTLGLGLDKSYPYGEGTSEEDGPSVPLNPDWNEIEVTDTTQFQMYLMWQPNTPSSIPAPIGVVSWNWSGGAVQIFGIWSVMPNSVVASSNPNLVLTADLPTWGSHVEIPNTPPCH